MVLAVVIFPTRLAYSLRCSFFSISQINAYAKAGDFDGADRSLKLMRSKGLKPNVVTYSSLIDARAKRGEINKALRLRSDMEEDGQLPNTITWNSLINGLGNACRVDDAEKLFLEMKDKNVSRTIDT
mmetsp:Transcript_17141/g.69389  ORF Transcript_17141/g.69389 Transcript_17141/m.69389 type:complete len:127 (+) Transcript_17141:1209-1589(+)